MDSTALLALVSQHKWVPLAALVIGIIVRLLKSDTKIPIDIPPRLRVWLALALGAGSAVLEAVTTGLSWKESILNGLLSTGLAVLGQNVVIDSVRNGKEFNLPGLIKPGVSPSPDAPPTLPPAKYTPPNIPPGLSALVVVLGILLTGCGVFWKALDLASDKAKCVVANQDLSDKAIFIKCAIQDPERYLDLLAETRAATKKSLDRAAAERASASVCGDAGVPDAADGGLR